MDIRQLKYFIEIANSKSISQAARNLFLTQPTLSLALKKIESDLNTKLFLHTEKPFQLTATGEALYIKGQNIVESFDNLIQEIHTMQLNSEKETIRLGLTTLYSIQFMDQISKFIMTNPNVELNIRQEGSNKLQSLLVDNVIDIALVSFPNNETDKITIEPLETSTKGYNVYVVIPHSNPLSIKDELTFFDLKDQNFASLTKDFMIGEMLPKRARAHGYEPNIIMYNNDLQVLLYSLLNSNSICLLPIEYKSIGEIKGLKWIPLKDKHSYYSIGVALRKSYVRSNAINDFISKIKEN